jgi:hypothetical protein
METINIFFGVVANVIFSFSLLLMFFRKYRKKASRVAVISFFVTLVFAAVSGNVEDNQAFATGATVVEKESLQKKTPAQSKSLKVSKTQAMADRIAELFQEKYNTIVEGILPEGALCREDGFCQFDADGFWMSIYPTGLVEIETSSQHSHADYREVCSAVFSATSEIDLDLASEIMHQAFQVASTAGSFKKDVYRTQVVVRPALSDILGCTFLRY